MEKNERVTNAFTESMAALANMSKIAANMTDPAKKEKQPKNETTNQQHQQSVNVMVGEPEKKTMPIIVKEKPETHIHKRFPDNRALTKEECALEEIRVKLEFEENERERNFRREMYEKERKERKEHEELERAERLRKEQEQQRRRKARNAVAGCVGVGLLGLIIYGCMDVDRDRRIHWRKLPEPKVELNIQAEGSVE